MFDILVYVFENYLPDACPGPDALAQRLTAAGFEEDAISDAIRWLVGLEHAHGDGAMLRQPHLGAVRLYDPWESSKLPADCRGFLAYLEQVEAIDAAARELIIERAMAVDNPLVPLGKFKVIVLMVMWRRQLSLDNLVFEDLLEDDDDLNPGPMH